MSASSYRAVGLALAAGGVVLFSIRPVLIKLAYGYVNDAVLLIALRMVFSLPFFLIAVLWLQRGAPAAPISRRDAWTILLLGFLGYYAASFLDFVALQYISAGLSRLVLFLYPTLVVLLSWLFLRKRSGLREVLALSLSYVGLALVLAGDIGTPGRHLVLGVALAFSSAVSYAVYLVIGSDVIRRVGSMRFTAYALSIASVLCIVQFLVLRPLSALELPMPVYWLSIAMGVGCTVIPTFMTSEALKRVGANQTAITGLLGPTTTIVLGWLGLDERMTGIQVFGTLLVLAGVLLVTLKPAPRS